MNSINRPRGRPRLHSVNFRVFFRVLLYEASLSVVFFPLTVAPGSTARAHWWSYRADIVRASAERYISREPERRFSR